MHVLRGQHLKLIVSGMFEMKYEIFRENDGAPSVDNALHEAI